MGDTNACSNLCRSALANACSKLEIAEREAARLTQERAAGEDLQRRLWTAAEQAKHAASKLEAELATRTQERDESLREAIKQHKDVEEYREVARKAFEERDAARAERDAAKECLAVAERQLRDEAEAHATTRHMLSEERDAAIARAKQSRDEAVVSQVEMIKHTHAYRLDMETKLEAAEAQRDRLEGAVSKFCKLLDGGAWDPGCETEDSIGAADQAYYAMRKLVVATPAGGEAPPQTKPCTCESPRSGPGRACPGAASLGDGWHCVKTGERGPTKEDRRAAFHAKHDGPLETGALAAGSIKPDLSVGPTTGGSREQSVNRPGVGDVAERKASEPKSGSAHPVNPESPTPNPGEGAPCDDCGATIVITLDHHRGCQNICASCGASRGIGERGPDFSCNAGHKICVACQRRCSACKRHGPTAQAGTAPPTVKP